METPNLIPPHAAPPPDLIERGATLLQRALALALIGAVLINVVNVGARYVFGQTITGVDELQIYLMVALAFFGSVVAMARSQHLRMDVLTRYFPARLQKAVSVVEALGTSVLCGFVSVISARYALRVFELGSVSENAHIPMWMPHSVVALAFGAMTLIALIRGVMPLARPFARRRQAAASQLTPKEA